MEMRGPAGEGGKGYVIRLQKSLVFIPFEKTPEPLTTDTLSAVSRRAGQVRNSPPAPGSVVTHCHMTSYSKNLAS